VPVRGSAFGDWIAVTDPDLGRLRMGARATLSAGMTSLALATVAATAGLPATGTTLGATIAMLASVLASDVSLRDQRVTSWLLAFPATLSLVLGTLAAPHHAASLALFVATIFAAVYVRRFGPRGNALGMIRVVRPQTPVVEVVAQEPSTLVGLAFDDVRDVFEEDPAALSALAERLARLLL